MCVCSVCICVCVRGSHAAHPARAERRGAGSAPVFLPAECGEAAEAGRGLRGWRGERGCPRGCVESYSCCLRTCPAAELERPPVLLAHARSHVRGAGGGAHDSLVRGDFPGLYACPRTLFWSGSAGKQLEELKAGRCQPQPGSSPLTVPAPGAAPRALRGTGVSRVGGEGVPVPGSALSGAAFRWCLP